MLPVGEALQVLGSWISLHAEAFDEGSAVVEGKDVELAVVTEAHELKPPVSLGSAHQARD